MYNLTVTWILTDQPSSSLSATPDDDVESEPNKLHRKTAIRYDSPPSPSELDYMVLPPLPIRRRKKSQKPYEETETNDNPGQSPIKEYFSSSAFQAGIEKLSKNIARRISRDGKRDADDKNAEPLVSTSRKSSAILQPTPRSSKDGGPSSRKPSSAQSTTTSRSSKDGDNASRKSSSIVKEPSDFPPVLLLANSPKTLNGDPDDVSFCWIFPKKFRCNIITLELLIHFVLLLCIFLTSLYCLLVVILLMIFLWVFCI